MFQVPYEILNKKFRIAQKTIDRELNQIQNATSELEKGLAEGTAGDISRLLGGVVERLQALKRKADESIVEELTAGHECKRRLDHLRQSVVASTTSIQSASSNQWKKVRLDRMIVEHLMRLGYYESAEKLAIRSGIRQLTNFDIFQVSRDVEDDLKKRHTTKCIAWCVDNKSKLRKINSTIEFQLRVQVRACSLESRIESYLVGFLCCRNSLSSFVKIVVSTQSCMPEKYLVRLSMNKCLKSDNAWDFWHFP